MQADHTDAPAGCDYAMVYFAFELSKSKWLLGVMTPRAGSHAEDENRKRRTRERERLLKERTVARTRRLAMTIPTSGLFGRLFEIRIGRILAEALSHAQLSSSAKADDQVFQMSVIEPKGRSMSPFSLPHHATSTRRVSASSNAAQRQRRDAADHG